MRIGGICIDWKVLAGLAAVGVGVLLLDPPLFRSVLPFLFVAACPLSMVAMMWGMRGMSGQRSPQTSSRAAAPLPGRISREEQLASARSQLADMQRQQTALMDQLRDLEAPSEATAGRASIASRQAS